MHKYNLIKRIEKLESLLHINESVSVSSFECETIGWTIEDELSDLAPDMDINDDNADNGFINIGLQHGDVVADYDIEVVDTESMKLSVTTEDGSTKRLRKCSSLYDCAKVISNHFRSLCE